MPTRQHQSRRHTQMPFSPMRSAIRTRGPFGPKATVWTWVHGLCWMYMTVLKSHELHGYRNPSELMNCCAIGALEIHSQTSAFVSWPRKQDQISASICDASENTSNFLYISSSSSGRLKDSSHWPPKLNACHRQAMLAWDTQLAELHEHMTNQGEETHWAWYCRGHHDYQDLAIQEPCELHWWSQSKVLDQLIWRPHHSARPKDA